LITDFQDLIDDFYDKARASGLFSVLDYDSSFKIRGVSIPGYIKKAGLQR